MPKITNTLINFTFVAATICALTPGVFSQDKHKTVLESITFRDSKEKIVNLTSLVKKKCTESLQKAVGENNVLVKFQPEYRNDAEKIIEKLEAVYTETQKLTDPLEIDDLKLYLLRMENVPANYKISEVLKGRKFYLDLLVFKTTDDLDLDVCNSISVCSGIFGTIPHELTHGVLDDLITRTDTRWFDEGLSEYVSNTVYKRLSPDNYREKIESYVPLVSLHRKDIRSNLLHWGEPVLHKLFAISQKDLSNEFYRYGAAYQLIKEIIADAEKHGLENPLGTLLTKLKEHSAKTGKPANTQEIISIIQNDLKIDPKAIGELDPQTQQGLVDETISLLAKDELSTEKKSSALYILAGIDGIKLPDRWINFLLDQIFQNKTSDANQRDIAATALVVRFNQDGFDELLKNYLLNDQRFRSKSLKKVKAELAEFSLRPRPDEHSSF